MVLAVLGMKGRFAVGRASDLSEPIGCVVLRAECPGSSFHRRPESRSSQNASLQVSMLACVTSYLNWVALHCSCALFLYTVLVHCSCALCREAEGSTPINLIIVPSQFACRPGSASPSLTSRILGSLGLGIAGDPRPLAQRYA